MEGMDKMTKERMKFLLYSPTIPVHEIRFQSFLHLSKSLEVLKYSRDLDTILKPFKEVSVNINYLYTCIGGGEKTV